MTTNVEGLIQEIQRLPLPDREQVLAAIIQSLQTEAAPLLADDLPAPLQEELKTLENLDDDSLWQVARSTLPADQERLYQRLLTKNSQGTITAGEKEKLTALGEAARRLTLKKAHAYMLLKWRGHAIPSLEELETPQ